MRMLLGAQGVYSEAQGAYIEILKLGRKDHRSKYGQ